MYIQGNGVRKIKKYLVEDAHEQIIDRAMFDKVQEMKGHIKEMQK